MITRERRDRVKSLLIRSPTVFRAARAGYIGFAALQRELFTIVRFVPRLVRTKLGGKLPPQWQSELPLQAPSSVSSPDGRLLPDPESIKNLCVVSRLSFAEGGDSIYLPPETWKATSLAFLTDRYPADAGVKIAKQPGNCESQYVTPKIGRSVVARKLTFSHRLQTLTFNFLHLQGIAPRLYDLLQITDGTGKIWTAYVVEHIAGEPLRPGDVEQVVDELKSLESRRLIKLVSGVGWGGIDFEPPNCNGNLMRGAGANRLAYVDVHNFILDRYQDHLGELAAKVASDSHFGSRSLLLGGFAGSFLYQEIPGIDYPAKRSPRVRMKAWDKVLAGAGVSIEGRPVFDVGCNLGLMGAEYLRRGAHWLHGWDQPSVVEAARSVLLSIGCTRFSLTGGHLSQATDFTASLPDHLRSSGNEAVLSYLAIRGHIGWPPALSDLPWRYMLYEGHQEDHPVERYVSELNQRIPVRLLATSRIVDGVSAPREIALLEREASK